MVALSSTVVAITCLALVGIAHGILLRLEKPGVKKLTDKPRGDSRQYQHSVLSNGLQVLNVQDDRALENAFAMAVQSGSSNDPLEFPGLAHFCEHMVFLGTEKYPEPSGFDNFMGENGGSNNAYTSFDLTVYFGQISGAVGSEAMDRFADFFRKPLFNRSFVEKEVHAIDSEHAKNVQSHSDRIVETMYSLASSGSPVSRFHTGNLETLYTAPMSRSKNPVDALEVYFRRYYCPDKMRLVTFGPEDLAEQLSTSEKLFGSIPAGSEECRTKPVNRYASPAPFDKSNLGKFLHIQGTQPSAGLWLHFPLPDVSEHFDSHPLNYINYILGYSGTDSLSRVLTDQLGLATDAGATVDANSAGSQLFFVATLTEKGLKDPAAVMDVLFSYLAEVRRKGVDEALYKSIANISALEWDWAENSGPMDTASELAEFMTRGVPVDKLLSAPGRIDKIDTTLVASLLEKINPENMNVALVYPPVEEEELPNASPIQRGLQQGAFSQLPFYNVSYSVQSLPEALGGNGPVAKWQTLLRGSQEPKVALTGSVVPRIPSEIRDVPTKIPLDNMEAVLPGSSAGLDEQLYGQKPRQLEDGLWYRSGWVTSSPKVTASLSFMPLRTPSEPEMSALDSMRLGLYSRLLSEEMEPKLVDLKATGVSGGVDVSRSGISVSFDGFAPLLPRLASEVLKEFNTFNANSSITDPKRFARVVQDTRESLTTYDDMPVSYANGDLSLLLTRGHSHKEALKALDQVTLESVARAAEELMLSRKLQLTSLAMGNLPRAEATKLVQQAAAGVQSQERRSKMTTSSDARVELISPVVNPGQPIELRTKNPRDGDPNDVAVVVLLDQVKTVESRVLLGLVGKILGTEAYNELRTVRQLGYVVQGGATSFSNVMAVNVMVQGIALDADQAEAAIQAVITDFMPRKLAELKQEELDSMKSALLNELVIPPVGASEEVGHFWGPVQHGGQCFQLQDEMTAFLNTTGAVTRKALQDAWAALATPSEGVRKKVVAKYFAREVPPLPKEAAAAAMWTKQGVPKQHQALLKRELARTLVVDHADSQTREQVLKTGGYFPTELKCSRVKS
jgi:insulysin